jgi:hypothetical protein
MGAWWDAAPGVGGGASADEGQPRDHGGLLPASKNPRPQPGVVIGLPPEGAGPGPQPSTFTDTVETRWALGARTLSRPSR